MADKPAKPKPRIVVLSDIDSDGYFQWVSDGWFSRNLGTRNTARGKRLMRLASAAIIAASNQRDAIRRLEEAGFEVVVSQSDDKHGGQE